MSERPKGEGFELPDELVSALENFTVDEDSEKSIRKKKTPKTKSQRRKNKKVKAQVKKITKNIRANLGIEEPQEETKKEIKQKKSAKYPTENVSRRVGGADFRKKATDLIEESSYLDDDEFEVEQPNPEAIEGLEFKTKELNIEDVEKVSSISELFDLIDKSEGVQGSQEFFEKDKLKMIIQMVQNGELGYEYITRSAGIRQKVFDILNYEDIQEVDFVAPIETPKRKIVDVEPRGRKIIDPNIETDLPIESEVELKPVEIKPKASFIRGPHSNNSGSIEEAMERSEKVSRDLAALRHSIRESIKKTEEVLSKSESFKEPNEDIVEEKTEPEIEKEKIDSEVFDLERILEEKGVEIIDSYRKLVAFEEEMKEHPFRKFLLNGFGFGKKEKNKLIQKSDRIEIEYKNHFDKFVDKKVEKRLLELSELHRNSKERRFYETIQLIDIPKSVLMKYPDIAESFSKRDPLAEGIHISGIVNEKSFPREFRVEISEIYPDIVEQKVREEIRAKEIASADKKYFKFLKK
jgi:hypothetical protein